MGNPGGAGGAITLIPALNPNATLLDIAREVLEAAGPLVVVDDGSRADSRRIFEALPPGARVLRHPVNRGKGAALKTGMGHIAEHWPDAPGVVTMDADGQHRIEDLLPVAATLAASPRAIGLGTRSVGATMPLRSRIGNQMASAVFRRLTGLAIHDTQTGLRAIPMEYLRELGGLPGEGFDYETVVLLHCWARNIPLLQVPIATRYSGGRQKSHFRPLADSFKIVRVLAGTYVNAGRSRHSRPSRLNPW